MQLNFTQIRQQLMKPFHQAQAIMTQNWQWLTRQTGLHNHQTNPSQLWVDAIEQDEAYRAYITWQRVFNKAMKQLSVIFKGVGLSPQALQQQLKALQTNVISPFQYDQALIKLARILDEYLSQPTIYCQTIQKVRADFKLQLADNNDKPILNLFYNDVVNGLIEQSRKSVNTEHAENQLTQILIYYTQWIPQALIDEISLILNKPVSALKQISQLNETLARDFKQVASVSKMEEPTTWRRFQQSTYNTWKWMQTHPKKTVEHLAKGTVVLAVGYGVHYLLNRSYANSEQTHNGFGIPKLAWQGINFNQKFYTFSQVVIGYELGRTFSFSPLIAGAIGLSSFVQTSFASNTFINILGGVGNDISSALEIATDGYIVLGRSDSSGAGNSDLLLQKWDFNSTLLWSKTWGGTNHEAGTVLQVVTDGYVVAGYTRSFGAGEADLLLQKWDVNGTLLWTKTWGRVSIEGGIDLKAVTDGYVVAGYIDNFGPGGRDLLLQKWDFNGTLLWSKMWGGSGEEQVYALQAVTDGYVIAGTTSSFSASDYDALLQKWDVNGTLLWSKTWGGINDDANQDIQVVSDGYIVAGYTRSFGAGNSDVLLQKWASNGTLLWSKTWGGTNDDGSQNIQVVSDGYVVAGYTRSFGAGNSDVLLQKWASNGTLLWSKTWGGTNDDGIQNIQVVSDGYVVAGYTSSFGAGFVDLLLQKWDLNGSLVNCNGVLTITNGTLTSPSVTINIPTGTLTTPTISAFDITNGIVATSPVSSQLLCYYSATTQLVTTQAISTQAITTDVPAAATTKSLTSSPLFTTLSITTGEEYATSFVTTEHLTTTPATTQAFTSRQATTQAVTTNGITVNPTTFDSITTYFNEERQSSSGSTAGGNNTGIIIGGIVAGLGVLVICMGSSFILYRRCQKPFNESPIDLPAIQSAQTQMLEIPFKELKLGRKLGEGSFGVVYQGAYHAANVAIKKLMLEKAPDENEALLEFQREMKLMIQLRHPNIVYLYGICSQKPPYCIVMEYLSKGSLTHVLEDQNERLPWDPIRWQIALDMAKGLAYLHANHIIHRDLKSLNVLLDAQHTAKLSDFGLSRIRKEADHLSTIDSVGTLQWMAPELFEPKPVYTQKSDIYSYGMILWELASRAMPYKDVNQFAIPRLAQEGKHDEVPQDTPRRFAKLIKFCWAVKPEDRPSIDNIIHKLEAGRNENNQDLAEQPNLIL